MDEKLFWSLQKKYNLSLDNENYDDLEKFVNEVEKTLAQQFFDLIVKEINIAHSEGQPTSRLTSLANKLSVLRH